MTLKSKQLAPKSIDIYRNDVVVNWHTTNSNRKGRKPEANIAEFTYASRARLAFLVSNTEVEFLSMATLTYPAEYSQDGKEIKRHLHNMLARIRRKFKGVDYLWFLEFQRRGAPHYHLLLTVKSSRAQQKWLSESWYEVVESGDEKHLMAGTNWENVRDSGGARKYAVKYAMKMRQKWVPPIYRNVGRFWGNSARVKAEQQVDTIEVRDEEHLRQLVATWKYAHKLTHPMRVLYNASMDVAHGQILDKTRTVD